MRDIEITLGEMDYKSIFAQIILGVVIPLGLRNTVLERNDIFFLSYGSNRFSAPGRNDVWPIRSKNRLHVG